MKIDPRVWYDLCTVASWSRPGVIPCLPCSLYMSPSPCFPLFPCFRTGGDTLSARSYAYAIPARYMRPEK